MRPGPLSVRSEPSDCRGVAPARAARCKCGDTAGWARRCGERSGSPKVSGRGAGHGARGLTGPAWGAVPAQGARGGVAWPKVRAPPRPPRSPRWDFVEKMEQRLGRKSQGGCERGIYTNSPPLPEWCGSVNCVAHLLKN